MIPRGGSGRVEWHAASAIRGPPLSAGRDMAANRVRPALRG